MLSSHKCTYLNWCFWTCFPVFGFPFVPFGLLELFLLFHYFSLSYTCGFLRVNTCSLPRLKSLNFLPVLLPRPPRLCSGPPVLRWLCFFNSYTFLERFWTYRKAECGGSPCP